MNTRTKTMFALGGALTLALCGGILLTAPAGIEASAVAVPSLFLPGSYEEYLPLEYPTDAAMSEHYIAVADGNTLYLYDRSEGAYTAYTHRAALAEVEFAEDGRLFFNDQNAQLYQYSYSTQTAEIQTNVPCATFLIEGNTLYTAAVAGGTTTLYAIPADSAAISFDRAETIDQLSSYAGASPRLAFLEGVLYCAFNHLVTSCTPTENGYAINTQLLAGSSTDASGLSAFTVHEGEFYYAVNGTLDRDGLYRTVLNSGSELLFEGSGFTSLFSYDGTLYGVQNGSVRAFSTENGAQLTGYEIGAGSNAPNRISGAGETVRAGDLLVIADEGNRRVLVYDIGEESFSSVPLGGEPACVATDGESFAVSVGDSIFIYGRGESTPRYTHTAESTVSGLTCVYGTYYYVTEHSYYGVAEEGAREFTRPNTAVPVAITSDLMGNIYVASASAPGQSAVVKRFTESEFLDYASSGTPVGDGWALPAGFRSLRADYEGSLYYLLGSALYRNSVRLETFDASSALYHGTGGSAPSPVSFALSFADGTVYLNYGDFMLTAEVSFPNLGAIPVEGLYEQLHTAPAAQSLSYVDAADGTVGIAVDLSALDENSSTLAYTSHRRIEGGSALVLGRAEQFLLLALYRDHEYVCMLVPEESCTPVLSECTATDEKRLLSSDASLMSYPLLVDSLTEEELPRGTQVTVLAEISPAAGFAFAEVRYGEDGHGYVLLDYLTKIAPLPSPNDEYRLGYLKANESGITFYAADDRTETIRVTERTQVKIYEAENGTFDVCFEDDSGTLYTAQVTEDMLEAGGEDALRISIIIVLCVIAVGIGAVYILLVPKKTKN